MTVGCARCHDHKFDPIPQKDYYALAGIFRSTDTEYGTFRIIQNNHPSSLISLKADSEQTKVGQKISDTRKETLRATRRPEEKSATTCLRIAPALA